MKWGKGISNMIRDAFTVRQPCRNQPVETSQEKTEQNREIGRHAECGLLCVRKISKKIKAFSSIYKIRRQAEGEGNVADENKNKTDNSERGTCLCREQIHRLMNSSTN